MKRAIVACLCLFAGAVLSVLLGGCGALMGQGTGPPVGESRMHCFGAVLGGEGIIVCSTARAICVFGQRKAADHRDQLDDLGECWAAEVTVTGME